MAVTVQSLGIDRLSRDERLALVMDIWDTIAAEPPPPLSAAKRAELDRRLADAEANPDDVVSWEDVHARLLDRVKSS